MLKKNISLILVIVLALLLIVFVIIITNERIKRIEQDLEAPVKSTR